MLYVITPTDGRPEAFAHLESWLGAQTWPEAFRWVVATGDPEPYDFRMGQILVGRNPSTGLHPLCGNLLAALDVVESMADEGDKVIIAEDDDAYAPGYFLRMAELLETHDLAGQGDARYYHVVTRRYRQLNHRDRASLAQTAFRPAVIPKFIEIASRGSPFIDLALWREYDGRKTVVPGEGLHVSLKGLPGTPGIGIGHREGFGHPDTDGRVFAAWGIPAVYEQYANRRMYETADAFLAPVRGESIGARPWEGVVKRKPWDYRVTAAIVHLDMPEALGAVVETLRAQTEQPYVLVIDAGSHARHRPALERMELEADDIEVHYLRPRAWRYSSEPVAVGMDLAFARCQTPYLYATHTDVFLKRPDYIADLVSRCDSQTPAVGYQMSPRPKWRDDRWKRTLSHTATLYHMPTMRRIGASWSMAAAFESLKLPHVGRTAGGFPDTETNLGLCLERAGIGVRWVGEAQGAAPSVLMLGPEANDPYENNDLIHVRSATVNAVYNRSSSASRAEQLAAAANAARDRARAWRERPELSARGRAAVAVLREGRRLDVLVDQCQHRGCKTGCGNANCAAGMGDQAGGKIASLVHCRECVARAINA